MKWKEGLNNYIDKVVTSSSYLHVAKKKIIVRTSWGLPWSSSLHRLEHPPHSMLDPPLPIDTMSA